jgi:predicted PurR-regulated permease PerM
MRCRQVFYEQLYNLATKKVRQMNEQASARPSKALVAVVLVLLALAIWYAVDVFLLAFGGVLLAVFLRSLSSWFSQFSGLSSRWSLLIVVVDLLAIAGLAGWLLASTLVEQGRRLREELPRAAERLQTTLDQYGWGELAVQQVQQTTSRSSLFDSAWSMAGTALTSTFGILGSLVVVVFVGLYLAAEPGVYRRGILHLTPKADEQRIGDLLEELGLTLRWWIFGKVLSMFIVGFLSWLGLMWLGISAPLAIALLTALLTFIPNFGPILSVIPPALLALLKGPSYVWWVIGLYVAIQTVESYLLTPMVQRRTIEMPPVLTIMAQVLLGVLAGSLGVILATPLVACALVITKRLYVEDVLHKELLGGESDKPPGGDQSA